jgi:hypothetical protein
MAMENQEVTEEDLKCFSNYEIAKAIAPYVLEVFYAIFVLIPEVQAQKRNGWHEFLFMVLILFSSYDLRKKLIISNDIRNKLRELMLSNPVETEAFITGAIASSDRNISSGAKRLQGFRLRKERERKS